MSGRQLTPTLMPSLPIDQNTTPNFSNSVSATDFLSNLKGMERGEYWLEDGFGITKIM
jgi:hypothetical protein